MYMNTTDPFKPKPKPAYPKNLLIIGAGAVIVGRLLGFGADGLYQGSLLSQYWGGMLGIVSGLVGLAGWIIIIVWITLYFRHRRNPAPAPCPNCGFEPTLSGDIFCRQCGTEL